MHSFARMTTLPLTDLALVTGGAPATNPKVCTTANPSGKPPQSSAVWENNHSGPSTNDRVMNGTNTLMSRGMSMFNDGRPSMPAQW